MSVATARQPIDTGLPAAQEATECLLGCMLTNPRDCVPKALAIVSASHMIDQQSLELFEAIERRHRMGEPIDPVLLRRDFADSDFRQGISAFMAEIAEKVPTTAHCEHYARIVAEVARKRQIFEATTTARQSSLNGKSSREILCELHAFADDALRDADPDIRELESFQLADFLQIDSKDEFLIDRCIPASQPGMLAARSKSLKSTTTMAGAFALATATPFLGEFEVARECRGGVITAESGVPIVQESFRRIARASGVTQLEQMRNFGLQVSTKIPHLVDQRGREQLERWIDKHSLDYVYVDPTYKAFAGVDDYNLSRMAEVLFPLSEIIDRTGCTLIFVHHNKKTPRREGDHYAEPTMEDIGGTGWQQWARFFLMLNRRREWDPDTGQHWLWFKTLRDPPALVRVAGWMCARDAETPLVAAYGKLNCEIPLRASKPSERKPRPVASLYKWNPTGWRSATHWRRTRKDSQSPQP